MFGKICPHQKKNCSLKIIETNQTSSNISRDFNSLVISTPKKNQLAHSALYPDTGDAWAQAFPGRPRSLTKR
ncbi:hypothetical protein MTR67_004459 [Solanum verrucosum]|uniref:Uncharacterized protein n=1 Tax=Solanum verrucosum TaxID=315347 RepID=A0AAF0Q026_SOLVR|nr:hypothetical protein MTR67_004459 [Solanum verrucosum]